MKIIASLFDKEYWNNLPVLDDVGVAPFTVLTDDGIKLLGMHFD